jgi:arsenite methyltransferase
MDATKNKRNAAEDKEEAGCGCGPTCCGGKEGRTPAAAEASRAAGCGCGPTCCAEERPLADRPDDVRGAVRQRYARIAVGREDSCCGGGGSCGSATAGEKLGYSAEDLGELPPGADMGLGCGNPQAIAKLKKGETVLDLGSGGGIDCFLAAKAVGPEGRVIGVDMTPEMVSKARRAAESGGYARVEFRLGEIERLPVADGTADVVISNCVINLSPDKPAVYREAFRALKPGGRLAVSDIVATAELPSSVRKDLELYTGCMAGASPIGDVEKMLAEAGFKDVRILPKDGSREFIREWQEGGRLQDFVVSASIEAVKP